YAGLSHDYAGAHEYLRNRCGADVPFTRAVEYGNRARFYNPEPVRQIPDAYRNIGRSDFNRPAPVGSIFRPGEGNQPGRFVPPTSNGRGIVAPPRAPDGQGHYQPL